MTITATRAASLPQTSPDTARDVATAEYEALLLAVDAFDTADWARPTDCTPVPRSCSRRAWTRKPARSR